MGRRLIDHDPITGISEWFVDNPDGTFEILSTQEVDASIERVTAERNAIDGHRFGEMSYVGTIPALMRASMPRDIANGNDQKGLQKWLIEHSKFLVRRW